MTIQHRCVTYFLGLLAPAILVLAAGAEEPTRDWSAYPMQSGQFDVTWESLEQYECPAWFRDAKFGIWAIIGPQCVPMQGDWYARHMYIQGHRQYEHHVKTYGHPSKFGYKDLIEKFDPKKLDFDKLVGLYKQAGARYAVILAVHHDNFDLWNFDGSYPFDKGDVGRRLVAHYYNINTKWHGGRNDAAMCIKKWASESHHGVYRDGTCVQDMERGRAGEMRELPWQTDTCIGGWYYRVGTKYKTPAHVAHMLIDIVSKNGNLLLNLPLHPDGSLDDDEIAFLDAMGQWMKVNGEAIYGTRPWVVFGEGPAKGGGGHFNESATHYTSRDFRYTAKGESQVYAPGSQGIHP